MLLHQFVNGTLEAMYPSVQKDTTFTKIFVGGLPYHTTDASLRTHFQTFGDIDEAVVIADRQTGKSRGYGFVKSQAGLEPNVTLSSFAHPHFWVNSQKQMSISCFPRVVTGYSTGVQQVHPALIQRQYGLSQPYVYPQAFLQPSLVLPAQVTSSATTPYLDFSTAYTQYASSAFEQYPYAPSPGFLSYMYPPGTPGPSSATNTPVPTALPSIGGAPSAAFIQIPPHQLHADRL
ncbi:RNA-binding protein 38-like [Sinocyclocheilus grahami]|uniref:RNA-binding protein 38-like n=1 Tax=Sinocyclocheilus grahami TaxID=75366 RepID=UPI0007AD571C|nr:PREDICTED: RNA-binding protein 38-like [Sinocyclocheilus grahami]